MNREELQYLDTIRNIVDCGIPSNDRTGVGTKYLIGQTFKYDLSENKIPIWTTRKIPWKNQVWELIWFLRGQTDVKWLQDRGVNIWNSWVKKDGTIGPGYGKQWRRWETFNSGHSVYSSISNQQFYPKKTIDQFSLLIEGIKTNPDSRRHVVTLWNPADMNDCVLPCCHGGIIQFIVEDKKYLHCFQYQRSADFLLGYTPWQYALLTNMIGRLTNLEPKSLTVTVGNCHVYNNQLEGISTLLTRSPKPFPALTMSPDIKTVEDIENSILDDYKLVGYEPDSFIKFPIAV